MPQHNHLILSTYYKDQHWDCEPITISMITLIINLIIFFYKKFFHLVKTSLLKLHFVACLNCQKESQCNYVVTVCPLQTVYLKICEWKCMNTYMWQIDNYESPGTLIGEVLIIQTNSNPVSPEAVTQMAQLHTYMQRKNQMKPMHWNFTKSFSKKNLSLYFNILSD